MTDSDIQELREARDWLANRVNATKDHDTEIQKALNNPDSITAEQQSDPEFMSRYLAALNEWAEKIDWIPENGPEEAA